MKGISKLIVNFKDKEMKVIEDACRIDVRNKSQFTRMVLLREAKRIIEEAKKNAKHKH